MRVLVIGGSGMLGSDLGDELLRSGHQVVDPPSRDLDIADPASVAQIAAETIGHFDWCVNCAAYTVVDKAETDVQKATEINSLGPSYLARACAASGTELLHLSTDFVFDGHSAEPYSEDAPTNPLSVYGRTKLDGENGVLEANPSSLIVRTSWLFGPNGNSFPKTMIKAWEAGKSLKVVADQIGSPTYTCHLAKTLVQIMERKPYPGIYHATGPNATSWHDLAKMTIKTWSGTEPDIAAISTEDWPTPATRPKYSVLSNKRLHEIGIPPMPPLDEALQDFCAKLRAL